MKTNLLLFAVATACLFTACMEMKPLRPDMVATHRIDSVKESTLNLPIILNTSHIEDKINKQVPTNLYSKSGIDLGNGISIQMAVKRNGNIKLSTDKGRINIHIPITIRGTIQCKVETKIKILQKIAQELQHKDFESNVTLSTSLKLKFDDNKNMASELVSDLSLDQNPTIEIIGLSIPYAKLACDYLKQEFPAITNVIDEKINEMVNVKQMMEKYWMEIKRPILITDKPVKIWGMIEPTYLNIAPAKSINDSVLELNLAINAYIKPYVEEKAPVPSVNELIKIKNEAIFRNDFQINLPVVIEIAELKKITTQELVGKTFPIQGTSRDILIKSFDVYGVGDYLVFNVGVKSKKLNGNIYLIGKPAFDPITEVFSVQNVDFDVHTNSLLVNKAAWLVNKFFLESLQKKMVYNASGSLNKARMDAEKVLNNLKVSDVVQFSGKVDDLKINSVYAESDLIKINVSMVGSINAYLNSHMP